ncbi:MAG: endopeptidase La [Paludibacter sp.]|nr:endopeptidase La [Bacteroidales bacterium]MCM1069520.1 endopeptidase La [Prevotella sp.]MCM1354176.1 endopeptidase La [Bacteroides sp.]MCM1442968.1 endopeptidase La [Muribaculum sp.]MCM1482250.1 endopeptidase La [Paludibacter sp.]
MRYELEGLSDNDAKVETQVISIVDGNDEHNRIKINDADVLGVLPLRNMVLFPGVLLPVTVARPKSLKLVKAAFEQEKPIAVCCQKDADVQEPQSNDIYMLGTAARVLRTFDLPDGSLTIILEGLERIMIDEIVSQRPYMKARILTVPEVFPKRNDKHFLALVSNIKDLAVSILKRTDNMPQEAGLALKNIDNPPSLVNYVCVNFNIPINDKQALLQQEKLEDRALQLLEFLNKEIQLLEIKQSIQEKAREDIDKQQREYFLHQQIQTIQKELGDTAEQNITDMRERAKTKKWNEDIAKLFDNELKKLERLPTHSPEYSTQQNYLETLLDLPWNEYTEDNFDIPHAQQVLDSDHYGMEKVKERILEYLSVLKMKGDLKSPIICLYGPPGVGKTSLGKSIAQSLGRKYARISLGGLHDEAEIRGHRRTYIGAMPGRIIQNIRKVKSSNPVFVLDEIDKMAADYHGDPTSALLEVLDPEQNTTFHDNFLDADYDLSKVLFIATANSLSSIPRPLLDRMELIEMTGYLQEEKVEIAKRHLIPKEQEAHGVKPSQLRFSKAVLNKLIDDYTRESGVRELDRKIAAIMRKTAKRIAMEEPYNTSLTLADLQTYLGKPRYSRDLYEDNKYIGVVTGLAWTQVGGEILFIETSLSTSKSPTLTLTGNLGDVMKESATIALGYIKAHAKQFDIQQEKLDTMAVHIHVPEGAIPKDGPSAGITMTTALVSAFTGRRVRERLAMTGEMTLRGKVLPVGGIKEKILAAKRAGITDIMLCGDNRKDIEEIPEIYLKGLTFHYVKDIQDVIAYALLPVAK